MPAGTASSQSLMGTVPLCSSMDFLTTDARTRTYTWQTGSELVEDETLPDGLAEALYKQRAGALASEQMTVRLGDSLPVIGDMADGLILQSYDIDLADLTARLVFGRPEHLSAEDMRSLLNGFRQRGYASTARIRKEEAADEDADEADAPGGIPPIASSEWAPGVKAKATIKKADPNANAGVIKLEAAEVPAGSTVAVRTLTVGSGSSAQTVKVLATSDVTVPEGGGSGSGTSQSVTVVTDVALREVSTGVYKLQMKKQQLSFTGSLGTETAWTDVFDTVPHSNNPIV